MDSISQLASSVTEMPTQMVDFDWHLKAIFGTNTMVAHPPPPLVDVDFHLCKTSNYNEKLGNVTETVKLEMNNQELKILLSAVEKALSNI